MILQNRLKIKEGTKLVAAPVTYKIIEGAAGTYTINADGSAETTLTVAQKDTKDTKDTGKTDVGKKPASKSAKTGDNSNLIAWCILLAASVCIVGSLRVIRRQRRR